MEPLHEAPAIVGTPADLPAEPRGAGAQLGSLEEDTHGARILVAEDNPVNAAVAVKMLEKRGHRPDLARDGRQALEMLAAKPYDAALMDCQMPELDGYEAAAEIRRREDGGPRIPIIAMTAHAMAGDREKCLAAGMDDYMSKPIRSDALHEMLLHWVKNVPETASAPPSDSAEEREAHVPLVDEAIVEDLQAAGAEALAAILELFVRDSALLVSAIHDRVSAGDATGVAEKAHLLKGGSASVGAARMAAVAGRIETLGRADTLGEAPPWLSALASDLEPSIAALRAALAPSGVQMASDRPAA